MLNHVRRIFIVSLFLLASCETMSTHYQLSYQNNCKLKITTAIYYKDLDGVWKTNGWWNLNPGQRAYVANTKNAIYFIYAKSKEKDGGGNIITWGGKDRFESIRGSEKKYGLFMKNIQNLSYGSVIQSFDCPNAKPPKADLYDCNVLFKVYEAGEEAGRFHRDFNKCVIDSQEFNPMKAVQHLNLTDAALSAIRTYRDHMVAIFLGGCKVGIENEYVTKYSDFEAAICKDLLPR